MCAENEIPERRNCGRWKVEGGEAIIKREGQQLRGVCNDISFKGAGVTLSEEIEKGEMVEAVIILPGKFPIKIQCKVIWQKKVVKNKVKLGLFFLRISDRTKGEIFDYILKVDPDQLSSLWWKKA